MHNPLSPFFRMDITEFEIEPQSGCILYNARDADEQIDKAALAPRSDYRFMPFPCAPNHPSHHPEATPVLNVTGAMPL